MDTGHGTSASTVEVSPSTAAATATATATTTTARMANTPTFILPAGGIRLADVERSLVEQALQAARGNQTQTAKLLGISRFALRSRLKRHHLHPRRFDAQAEQ